MTGLLKPGPGGTTVANTITGGVVNGHSVQAGVIQTLHLHHPALLTPPTPHQLLPVPASFTDRVTDMAAIETGLKRLPADTARIVAISGGSGIGKSALATRFLHQRRDRFPAGQLYADLRGYAPEGPARTPEVLAQLLRSLRPGAQPTSPDELAASWRSATAADPDRPVCLLLDNAVRADQIRHLLPGGSGHLVIATSRELLADLASDGAVLHQLGPFDEDAVLDYLTRCLGEDRVSRTLPVARQIARLTAGLPFALALTVNELVAQPDRSLAELNAALSARLPQPSNARIAYDSQEAAVTTALDHAYQQLPPAVGRAYRRLGNLFLLDLDTATTAAACNLTHDAAAQVLEDLHEAHLLEAASADAHPARGPLYRFHDAARAHAAHLAAQDDTTEDQAETLRRTLDFYLATTTTAERLITPTHRPLARDYDYLPAEPITFPDEATALAWLKSQRYNTIAAIRAGDTAGLDGYVWQQAHAWWVYLRESHDYPLWFESHELGIQAARRGGDCMAERELLGTMGVALRGVGRYDEAFAAYTRVLESACADRDERSESQARHELGTTRLQAGLLDEAVPLLLEARALRARLGERADNERDQIFYRRGMALTDICLGKAHLGLGRPGAAITALTSARAVLLSIPDPFDAGRALAWLARAHAQNGELTQAETLGRQAADEFAAHGAVRWTAHSLEMLGQTVQEAGRRDQARKLLIEALRLYEPISRRDANRVQDRLQRIQ